MYSFPRSLESVNALAFGPYTFIGCSSYRRKCPLHITFRSFYRHAPGGGASHTSHPTRPEFFRPVCCIYGPPQLLIISVAFPHDGSCSV